MSIKIPQTVSVQSGSMKHQISTSTAPAVSVSYMTDPTAVRDSMQVIDQDVISLGQKPFLAKRVMVKLENSVLLFQQTSHRVRSHTTVGSNMMAYAAIGPRAKGTLDGIRMRPELLIIAAPGSEGEMVVDAGYSSVSLLIPPEDLLDHLSARGRGDEFFMPNRADFLRIRGLGTRPYSFDFDSTLMRPVPTQPGGIPFLLASHHRAQSPAQIRRAARLGAGIISISDTPEEFAQVVGQVQEKAAEFGADCRASEQT